MKTRENFLPAFLIFVFLCIALLTLSVSGKLKFLSFLEKPASEIQSLSFGIFHKLPFVSEDREVKKLKEENLELLSRVSGFERLKRENQALSDQFQIYYPASYRLLEASVIGAPGFVPGVSLPGSLILNKGSKDNLKVGQAVVIKDNLVGIIVKVSDNLSQVNTINNFSSSFTAKTANGAQGIAKGTGSGLTLNSVLLSENIKDSEIVLTKGDIDFEGVGVPPDMVVGKVTEIEKSASDLFQKAKIESFVDFMALSTVFVYINSK